MPCKHIRQLTPVHACSAGWQTVQRQRCRQSACARRDLSKTMRHSSRTGLPSAALQVRRVCVAHTMLPDCSARDASSTVT